MFLVNVYRSFDGEDHVSLAVFDKLDLANSFKEEYEKLFTRWEKEVIKSGRMFPKCPDGFHKHWDKVESFIYGFELKIETVDYITL
jgi:hypothetical protein